MYPCLFLLLALDAITLVNAGLYVCRVPPSIAHVARHNCSFSGRQTSSGFNLSCRKAMHCWLAWWRHQSALNSNRRRRRRTLPWKTGPYFSLSLSSRPLADKLAVLAIGTNHPTRERRHSSLPNIYRMPNPPLTIIYSWISNIAYPWSWT